MLDQVFSVSSTLICCFRRESEHDQMVRSIYEEMENQIKEEHEKYLVQV